MNCSCGFGGIGPLEYWLEVVRAFVDGGVGVDVVVGSCGFSFCIALVASSSDEIYTGAGIYRL